MRILIKQIEKGIYVQEEDRIASFDIIGQFKNGIHIKIKDNVPYDLRKFSNNEIECLLLANLSKFPEDISSNYKPSHLILEGTYMGKYFISEKWKVDDIYQLDPDWHDFNYHAIQTEHGIIIVRSNKLINYKIMEGDKFRFKVIDFELMAWKPILGEKEIDPLAYEKNFIEKFWDLMDSTRKNCNQNAGIQKNLIYKQLLNWNLSDIWLTDGVLRRLIHPIRTNQYLKEKIGIEKTNWWDFCFGIITLGKNAYTDAVLNPKKFLEDVKTGVYSRKPEDIITKLIYLFQDVVEEKMGKSLDEISTDDYMNEFLREDIEDLEKRIVNILDDEFKIVRG